MLARYMLSSDRYPRIDILRISAILTDTDRIRIVTWNFLVWTDTDTDILPRIFYGYALRLIVIIFKIYFMCIVYIYVHLDVIQTKALIQLSLLNCCSQIKHGFSKPYIWHFTHADRSRGGDYYLRLSVCLSAFRTISQKPMQLGSPNLFHDESWKPIYFGDKKLNRQQLN